MMYYCPELEGDESAIINGLMESQDEGKGQYTKPTGLFQKFFDIYKTKTREFNLFGNTYLKNYLKSIIPDYSYQTIANWATDLGIAITNNTGDTTRTYQFRGNKALDFQSGFFYTVFAEDGLHLFRPTITGINRGTLSKQNVLALNQKAQTNVHYAGEIGYDYTIRPSTDKIIPDIINSTLKTLALQKYKSDKITFSSGTDMDAGDYVVYNTIRWIVLSKKYDSGLKSYTYQAISEVTETYSFSASDESPVTYLDTSANNQATAFGKYIGVGVAPLGSIHTLGTNSSSHVPSIVLDNTGTSDGAGTAIYMGYQSAGLGLYGARILNRGNPGALRSSDIVLQVHNTTASNAEAAWDTALYIQRTTRYVGIMTESPTQSLHVNGGIAITGNVATPPNPYLGGLIDYVAGTGVTRMFSYGKDTSTRGLYNWTGVESDGGNALTYMTITELGNIGIQTTAPLSALSVNGGVHIGGDADAGDNNLLVDGFSTFGSGAPKVKFAQYSATTGSSQGASTLVTHSLTGAKIISLTCKIAPGTNDGMVPGYTYIGGYEYQFRHDSAQFSVELSPTNSGSILQKPITIFAVYIE